MQVHGTQGCTTVVHSTEGLLVAVPTASELAYLVTCPVFYHVNILHTFFSEAYVAIVFSAFMFW